MLLPCGQINSGGNKLTAASLQHVNVLQSGNDRTKEKKNCSIIDPPVQIPHYFIEPVRGLSLRTAESESAHRDASCMMTMMKPCSAKINILIHESLLLFSHLN